MSNVNRADKQRAYFLHKRPFSETSLIGYFFTRDYGIVHLMMKGARRTKGLVALLQPSLELQLSWSGHTDLKNLRSLNLHCRHSIYGGRSLMVLMYVGELLFKLLKPFDAHVRLYDSYHHLLLEEAKSHAEENLRRFEHILFAELGYGLSLNKDYETKEDLIAEETYCYEPGKGFRKAQGHADARNNIYAGWMLASMRAGQFEHPDVRRAAKRLSRSVLHHLLDGKPVLSRRLFAQPQIAAPQP